MKKLLPWAANILSGTRLLLVPPLLACAANRAWGPACAVFAAAGLTDLLDGPLARAGGGGGRLGAVLDLAADFGLVFPLSLLLAARGTLSPALPALAVLSFLSYVATRAAKGSLARHRFGRYAGAVCASCLGAILFLLWLGDRRALRAAVQLIMAAGLVGSLAESGAAAFTPAPPLPHRPLCASGMADRERN